MPPEAEKAYNCSYCGKSFGDSLDLVAHERAHIGEKIYKCPHCEKQFSHWIDLLTHKKNHQREKPFECSTCNKSFVSSSHLISHKQELGLSISSFVISPNSEQDSWTPGKMQLSVEAKQESDGESHFFGDGQQQENEEATFQLDRPEQTDLCGIPLERAKGDFFQGLDTGHTGEKPYACLDCGKSFTRKSTLVRHKRVHTGEKPYSCSDCGQSFSRRLQFVIHWRSHTGETPYRCAQCGKCFTRRSSLLTHEKIHTQERTYKCLSCKQR